MTRRSYYIGSHGPFYFDDSKSYGGGPNVGDGYEGLLAYSAKVEKTPAVDNDAFRLIDANGRILIPVQVADIDDPTELNSYDGENESTILMAYQQRTDFNKVTLYAYDTNVTTGANSPYVVDAATAGTYWVAFSGYNIDRDRLGVGLLGPELVTNGAFTVTEPGSGNWSVGNDWAYNSTDDAMSYNRTSSPDGTLSQTVNFRAKKFYRVQYTILNYVSGGFSIGAGGASVYSATSNGTFIDTIQASAVPSTTLSFVGGAGDDLDVTDISVREILDIDFLMPIFSNYWARLQMDQYSSNTTAGSIFMNKARGTVSSPSAVASGDRLFEIRVGAHDGTGFRHTGTFQFLSTGTPSGGHVPARFEILVDDGSALQYRQVQNERSLGLFRVTGVNTNTGFNFVELGDPQMIMATKYTGAPTSSASSWYGNGAKFTSGWTYLSTSLRPVAFGMYLGNFYVRTYTGTISSFANFNGNGSIGESLRVESNGDTYMLGEVKGSRLHLEFGRQLISATSTGTVGYYLDQAGVTMISHSSGFRAIRAGSIVGFSHSTYITSTTVSNINYKVYINGALALTVAVTNSAGQQSGYTTQARNTDTFSAGDYISVQLEIVYGGGSTTINIGPLVALLDIYYNT